MPIIAPWESWLLVVAETGSIRHAAPGPAACGKSAGQRRDAAGPEEIADLPYEKAVHSVPNLALSAPRDALHAEGPNGTACVA